jgi:aminoglycoside 3-N-acetyltransferase
MQDLVGPSGTVMFPTFNFQSWTESHYFDILETPSKMGMITDQARMRKGAKRTPHPIFSFAVLGRRADEFAATEDVEAYGPNSAFALFHQTNGTIVSIGLDLITFSCIITLNSMLDVITGRSKGFPGSA